jgi:hypothetical protein
LCRCSVGGGEISEVDAVEKLHKDIQHLADRSGTHLFALQECKWSV